MRVFLTASSSYPYAVTDVVVIVVAATLIVCPEGFNGVRKRDAWKDTQWRDLLRQVTPSGYDHLGTVYDHSARARVGKFPRDLSPCSSLAAMESAEQTEVCKDISHRTLIVAGRIPVYF